MLLQVLEDCLNGSCLFVYFDQVLSEIFISNVVTITKRALLALAVLVALHALLVILLLSLTAHLDIAVSLP